MRTGEERNRGISWLIMPMDSPGIEIRPLRTIEGTTEFAQLFLNDVRIPVANRVGEENDGWRVTMVTLSFERGTAFVGELLECMRLLGELHDIGTRLDLFRNDSGLQKRIGRLVAAFDALWALTKRNVSEAAQTGVPGIGGSVFKLSFSEHAQALGDLAMEMLDTAALCADPLTAPSGPIGNAEQVHNWYKSINLTIAAGTSQVQRNIVAERILGLPEDALMDFRVSEAQTELAEGIRSMLAGRLPLERIRAREGEEHVIDADDWAALGDTGVFALTLPEPAGTGLGLADATVVFEELGRALVPGPLVGTFLAAARDLVPGTAEGRAMVGVVSDGPAPWLVEHLSSLGRRVLPPHWRDRRGPEPDDRHPRRAHRATGHHASRPAHAAVAVVPAAGVPESGRSRRRALPGRRHPHGGAAGGSRRSRPWSSRSPTPRNGSSSASRSAASRPSSTCAPTCSCAPRWRGPPCTRRPAWPTRPTCSQSEATAAGTTPFAWQQRAAAGAKLLADEAAITNARVAIQVHGGMGYTWEVPLHLHLKRSRVLATTFGTSAFLSSLLGGLVRPPAA